MNKLKITTENGLTKVYIDGVELKGIRSISYKQTYDSCAVARIEFCPEIEIESDAIVEKKPRAIYDKCGECKWLDTNRKCCIGCMCTHPDKNFASGTAMWKRMSEKACKKFERKDGRE